MTWTPPPPPPRQRHRRYEWCRLRNDFPDLPVWRAVAKRAQTSLVNVLAVAFRLECLANKSDPRGSVADMSIAEFAASLQLRPAVVARIRLALEEPDIVWIDQDVLVDFLKRNPDELIDPSAAERKRRSRAKLRAERARNLEPHVVPARAEIPERATGPPVVHSLSRDIRDTSRDGHARSDHIFSPAREAVDNGDAVAEERPIAADEWLTGHGITIVADRMDKSAAKAAEIIARWCRDSTPAIVAAAIEAADKANYVGAQFHNLVTQHINRMRQTQHALPLGPIQGVQSKQNSG